MKKMQSIISKWREAMLLLLLLISQIGQAQITPSNYEYTMSVTSQLYIDGNLNNQSGYIIQVYDGAELLGTSEYNLEINGGLYSFLTVYSNNFFETYTVRIISIDSIVVEIGEISFESNSILGSISNPVIYSIGSAIQGCIDATASNYNSEANIDNGTCITVVYGCTNNESQNFEPLSNTDDGSCLEMIEGCIDYNYVNFNPYANVQDNSCTITWQQAYIESNNIIDSLISNQNVGNSQVDLDLAFADGVSSVDITIDNQSAYADGYSAGVLSVDNQSTIIEVDNYLNMPEGWSLLGYTCSDPLDVQEAFVSVNDEILIVKDYLGNTYIPEFNFNGIGDLIYGVGYQIKLAEDVEGFQFCKQIIISTD
jgi:hypothetical protein